MSTTLDEPAVVAGSQGSVVATSAATLRRDMAAMRLGFTWFGVRKALSNEQRACAADAFGAEGEFLSAGKKLLDTKDPQYRAVTAVRGQATSYFKRASLPFPEPGVRLVRRESVESVATRLGNLRDELRAAAVSLDERFGSLKAAARDRLGTLFNEADYPATLVGMFDLSWDFPSVEPPDYLRQLSPELYRQECDRVRSRFDEAVRLAEQAFLEELSRLVSHLVERLDGEEDGRPKVFRDSAVSNLDEFFQRFRRLNVGSNNQLDELVDECQRIVHGVRPQGLRDDNVLRTHVAEELSRVGSALDELMVDRPRRNIVRRR